MPRRASLPGADLLFGTPTEPRSAMPAASEPQEVEAAPPSRAKQEPKPAVKSPKAGGDPAPGKPRHEEKVTFYCTASDLTRLEAARLDLRANYRLSSDRGRIVRAAIAEILDDFDTRGADSLLVKRLSSE